MLGPVLTLLHIGPVGGCCVLRAEQEADLHSQAITASTFPLSQRVSPEQLFGVLVPNLNMRFYWSPGAPSPQCHNHSSEIAIRACSSNICYHWVYSQEHGLFLFLECSENGSQALKAPSLCRSRCSSLLWTWSWGCGVTQHILQPLTPLCPQPKWEEVPQQTTAGTVPGRLHGPGGLRLPDGQDADEQDEQEPATGAL